MWLGVSVSLCVCACVCVCVCVCVMYTYDDEGKAAASEKCFGSDHSSSYVMLMMISDGGTHRHIHTERACMLHSYPPPRIIYTSIRCM